jgi:hypothetical protein
MSKTLGLGPVSHYCELTDDFSTDPLLASIKTASNGGQDTTDYFNRVNSMSQLFQQLANSGSDAWSDDTDDTIGLAIKYITYTDSDNNTYYIKIGQDQMADDGNGNVVLNGSTATIKGVTYNGVGMITMTCGYSNYTFSKTSWWAGTSLGGAVATKVLWPLVSSTIKSVATNLADQLKSVFQSGSGGDGGDDAEEAEETADETADTDIEADVGDVAIEEVTEEGAIALGDVFIGVGIALAILFVILSFVLHNSYHSLRVWNLTKYSLTWTIHFDTGQPEDQGQLVSGPVVFDSNNNITQYTTFLPISFSQPVPGAKKVWSCHYADMNVNSSHEYSGIGYVLQFYLNDDSGTTVYTATMYFDIPFKGDNSTDVSLDSSITDLQGWYDDNSGKNTKTVASTTSSDGVITLSTTYDFLDDKHPVPNTPQGQSSNEQYFYQSVVTILQNNLSQKDVAQAAPVPAARLVPVKKPGGKGYFLKSVRPSVRKQVMAHLKNLGAVRK